MTSRGGHDIVAVLAPGADMVVRLLPNSPRQPPRDEWVSALLPDQFAAVVGAEVAGVHEGGAPRQAVPTVRR